MVDSQPKSYILSRVGDAVKLVDLEQIIDDIDDLTEGAKVWAREHLVLVVMEDE